MLPVDVATLLSSRVRAGLCCPICHSTLRDEGHQLLCVGICGTRYPAVAGVPVLIDETTSVFNVSQFVEHRPTFFVTGAKWYSGWARHLPELGRNFRSERNFVRFAELLRTSSPNPLVLVIGAGEEGRGIRALSARGDIEVVNSDVSFTRSTDVIGDAHELPFVAGLFDGVVAQAVLEHVLDPYKCSEEIHRVLKPGGLVYAETPFMQQVHGGRYDFTRFTFLGHRRLFRRFQQIEAGPGGGPASALAWSYEYFLLSLVPFENMRPFVKGLARLTAFWLKYLDLIVQNRPRSIDAAWGFFFLGSRDESVLSDRELLALYPPDRQGLKH